MTSVVMQIRARFAKSRHKTERIDRMVTDIVLGVPKDESPAVIDADDSRVWDLLEPGIRAMIEDGHTVVLDNDEAAAFPGRTCATASSRSRRTR